MMHKLFVLLGIMVLATGMVLAEQVTVYASGDAMVNGSASDRKTNYGHSNIIFLRHQNDTWGCSYGLVKFDLSAVPSNAVINSARMMFYVDLVTWPTMPTNFAPVAVFANDADWSAGDVTFASAPGYSVTAVQTLTHFANNTRFTGTGTLAASAQGWLEYNGSDITDLVQSWVNGSKENYGVSIICTGDYLSDGRLFSLKTLEHPTDAVRPKLIITYTRASKLVG